MYFKKVLGDKLRYMQIMTNFLTNAIKFSVPGGTVSILLKLRDVKEQSYKTKISSSKTHIYMSKAGETFSSTHSKVKTKKDPAKRIFSLNEKS